MNCVLDGDTDQAQGGGGGGGDVIYSWGLFISENCQPKKEGQLET